MPLCRFIEREHNMTCNRIRANIAAFSCASRSCNIIYGCIQALLHYFKADFFADYPGCSEENLSSCPTLAQWMEDYFGYKYGMRWWCVLIIMGFIIVFRVGAMVALKVVSHDSR